jgi:outer membrane protein assembly factor BamA
MEISPASAVRSRALRPRLLVLLLLVLLAPACATRGTPGTGPFPRFSEFEGREIRRVELVGELELRRDSLQRVIATRPSRCRILFLPVCIPGTRIGRDRQFLNLRQVANDVLRLQLYYRDHGFYGTRVEPDVEPVGDQRVDVRFAIAPGDQVLLTDLSVEGAEEIVPPAEMIDRMPLTVGEPFRRSGFLASADTVRSQLLQRGHAYADVLRNYTIDTIADVAEANFVAIPGPLVYVDTILFEGVDRITEATLRRHLTFREGSLLRAVELVRSQRNVYGLEMVAFASIEIAPDTLQVNPALSEATVLVRVVEAPQFLTEASAGFGTIDCFRTGARWLNRNFLGGGRRLEVTGNLSKIGVGEPLDFGMEGSLCARSREPEFAELLNYRLGASFTQPRLFDTRNQLTVNLFSERFSELDAYLRERTGGQLAVIRALGENTMLTTIADVENGRTIASPVVLCIGFEFCDEEDLAVIRQRRWSNALSLAAVRDMTRTLDWVTRGYNVRGQVDWASPVLASDNEFLRVVVEGSAHRGLGDGLALSSFLRVGRFLQGGLRPDGPYIPPERRFYAGGPNSVRGYGRNALGPTAYAYRVDLLEENGERELVEMEDTAIVATATGGTQTVVASAELRMPSPWFSEFLRLAAFVDAGHLSVPGEGLGTQGLRVTPGVGARVMTPVGPIRLDIGYNPHPPEPGPLYEVDRDGIRRVMESYQPPARRFWNRFRVHFAVGQAF